MIYNLSCQNVWAVTISKEDKHVFKIILPLYSVKTSWTKMLNLPRVANSRLERSWRFGGRAWFAFWGSFWGLVYTCRQASCATSDLNCLVFWLSVYGDILIERSSKMWFTTCSLKCWRLFCWRLISTSFSCTCESGFQAQSTCAAGEHGQVLRWQNGLYDFRLQVEKITFCSLVCVWRGGARKVAHEEVDGTGTPLSTVLDFHCMELIKMGLTFILAFHTCRLEIRVAKSGLEKTWRFRGSVSWVRAQW